MTRCRTVQEDLTAWVDGELPASGMERIREHLAGCGDCAAEAQGVRVSIALQRRMLPQLTAVGVIDTAALHARLRHALAAEPEPRPSLWRWMLRPLVLAPAFAMVLVLALFTAAGGPTDVLAPVGVVAPPAAVKKEPGLFKDYTLIQHLDALQNFDTVEAEPLDDEQDAQTG